MSFSRFQHLPKKKYADCQSRCHVCQCSRRRTH